jgi:hypothetical protein
MRSRLEVPKDSVSPPAISYREHWNELRPWLKLREFLAAAVVD